MPKENEPTNSELLIMMQNLHSVITDVKDLGKETNSQSRQTGLDLNVLSKEVTDLSGILAKHGKALFDPKDGVVPWKDKVWGAIKIFGFIWGILVFLFAGYLNYKLIKLKVEIEKDRREDIKASVETITKQISSDVVNTLENRYDLRITQ